jgi:phospholipid/cholesterol/gamma-HCH transport system substrate-binding protein/paraquat-inducible protein B
VINWYHGGDSSNSYQYAGRYSTTIENLKQTSEQLNEFSRIASQSPSSIIWVSHQLKLRYP